jgi:hypothetical protein
MTVYEVYQKMGKELVKECRRRLTLENHNATKELYNSLSYKILKNNSTKKYDSLFTPEAGGYTLVLVADHYWYYVDAGRKPGKQPRVDPIEKWIGDKKLNVKPKHRRGVAFAIAKKIGEDGIKPTHIFTRAFEIVWDRNHKALTQAVKDDATKQMQKLINETFKWR